MKGNEGEAEERGLRRHRGSARSEDEEDKELLRSGVFDDDVSGDGGDQGERARSSGEAEKRGRSSGSGCGFMEPEEEGRPARAPNPPYVPTAKERREHSATHYPPRSWCKFCVEGRGVASSHHRCDEERVGDIGELHFDYCVLAGKPGTE